MSFSSSYIIKAIDQFSPVANRVSQNFDKISNKATRAAQSTGRFSKVMSRMSTAQAIATSSIGYYVFNTLTKFSEEMQGVKSVAEVTGVSFAQLEAQAKELGRTTRYTASDAAAAQYFLAKAGYDTQKIYDSMPQTLLLASAANLDIAQSADIVTNIMAGYQMNAEQLSGAVDVLAKAFSSANTDLVDLGTAMKYAGPVASGMGIDFKEAAAAIGMMGNAGIQGSMAGTSLRGALVRLANPTKQVMRYIRGLRLDIYKSDGSIKSLTEIVKELERSGATTAHMMAIFGQRAGPAMAALVSQGSDELIKFQKVLDNSTGFAQKAADTRLEGLYGTWVKLKSATEGLIHSLGDAGLTAILVDVGKVLTGILNTTSTLIGYATKLMPIIDIIRFTGGEIGEAFGDAATIVDRQINKLTDNGKKGFFESLFSAENIAGAINKVKNMAPGINLTPDVKAEDIQSLLDLTQTNKSEVDIKLQINDRNNVVGNVEANQKSIRGAWEHLKFEVGRSSAGQ